MDDRCRALLMADTPPDEQKIISLEVHEFPKEYSDQEGFRLDFDADISEEEKKFYTKIYPIVDLVCDRKVHCTVCDAHIGTAPAQESTIRMHPILRVTHCKKCHDFYNSGEFSKGEDGSELYCRWCGQGGEVYCCSKCPYVFCKNCIVLNLSKGVINDIEENENWNCFVCAPKIMWHLRAQHWALMNLIEKQKKSILSDEERSDFEIRKLMTKDRSHCCKPQKRPRSGNLSDSSCDSEFSVNSKKRRLEKKIIRKQIPKNDLLQSEEEPEPKRTKPNDEVVCTPDVMSMLQPDSSEIDLPPPPAVVPTPPTPTVTPTPTPPRNHSAPQIHTIPTQQQHKQQQQRQTQTVQQPQIIHNNSGQQQHNNPQPPPPLIIRNFSPQFRTVSPTVVTRKTVVGPRPPSTTPGQTPVYHTINGFRIDLNTAAQQETFRLPNGKLIQVKKQGTATGAVNPNQPNVLTATTANNTVTLNNQVMRAQITPRPIQPNSQTTVVTQPPQQTIQHFQIQQPQLATIRYAPASGQVIPGTTTITATIPNGQGGTVHLVNGTPAQVQQVQHLTSRPTPIPTLVRQFFSATPLGQARSQLQNQIFSSMDICQHLTGKIHTLTNSNAYKSVRNYTDVKELYIHLSYLFTYAIGRFKGLQDKCLEDMRRLGFAGDAASLESGQLEKHASEGDEDEVEIVEPKTTCIDLDSDNEDTEASAVPEKRNPPSNVQPAQLQRPKTPQQVAPQQIVQQIQTQTSPPQPQPTPTPTPPTPTTPGVSRTQDNDFEMTANLLAGMLEIELHEGNGTISTSVSENVPKKPRKKTTNKPNPHLIKQQQLQERERMKEMIRRDAKLNADCNVVLDRIEEVMPEVQKLLDDNGTDSNLKDTQQNSESSSPNPNDLSKQKEVERVEETSEKENNEDAEEILTVVETIIDDGQKGNEKPEKELEKNKLELDDDVSMKEDEQSKSPEENLLKQLEEEDEEERREEDEEQEQGEDKEQERQVSEEEKREDIGAEKQQEDEEEKRQENEEEKRQEIEEEKRQVQAEKRVDDEVVKVQESEKMDVDEVRETEENEATENTEDKDVEEMTDENSKESEKTEKTEENNENATPKERLKSPDDSSASQANEKDKDEDDLTSSYFEDLDMSTSSHSLFSERSRNKSTEQNDNVVNDPKPTAAVSENGFDSKSCEDISQDSMRHSLIGSGDSLDFLAAMEE